MPTITIQSPAVPTTPVTEIPDSTSGFIRLPDGEVYFHNGTTWVGLNGARSVYLAPLPVVVGDAVVVDGTEARRASAVVDKSCSGIVTHITPERNAVVVSAGRITKTTITGTKYYLGVDGQITASPNPDTQHIVLLGTGEGDSLLITLGVASEAPI
jgi:hypothetical protein